jgi:amino acid adenylation domain-containing protein
MNRPVQIDPTDARRRLMERMLRGDAAAPAAVPDPITPRDPSQPVPLSAEQHQLWLHAEMAPDMPLYNETITIRRHGVYDHAAMEAAMTEIVRRHPIWRTGFVEIGGELRQEIAPPMAIALPLVDLTTLPEGEREAEATRLAAADAHAAIALDAPPLFRGQVMRIAEDEHRLYLTLHHIIFDGVSIYRTMLPELIALFDAFTRGVASPLAPPPLDYADYAAWQAEHTNQPALDRQLDYWRKELTAPLPRLELAADRPRPARPTHAGDMALFTIDAALAARLRMLARTEQATLYMVMLAAFKAMLFRYTGDNDLIVGGVTDTRRRPELQSVMGYFLNSLALRSHPRGDVSFRAFLGEVKARVLGALDAADVPFDRIVRELDIRRETGGHPLFNTLFSIQPPLDPLPAGWQLTEMDVPPAAAKYDLFLELHDQGADIAGRFYYSSELFDPATIERMIGHWLRLLNGIAADPDMALQSLPLLGEEERHQLVDCWNDTAQPLPYASVVDWVAAQAAAAPDALVLEQGDLRWSYADLDAHADGIAAQLAEAGVAPGALVGLSLSRTPWMVAAMLGVAKAGAAYLPLDPAFPPARLAMIVDSAAPALILVEADTETAVPAGSVPKLRLDRDRRTAPQALPPIDRESLAYVLYTSGSTGKPKGVEIPHAALINLLLAMQQQPGFAAGDSILAITTLSFDIAELELWLPLVSGGRIILAPREAVIDMAQLAALIADTRPTMMQATPATWRGLIEAGWPGQPGLRALCGGEALPAALVDQILPRVGELWNVYGPTETTIWSTVAQVRPGDSIVPIGRPIANTQVRVLDADGNDRPIGAVGELHIGGRGLARGYRGRPDLTADRFISHDGTRLYKTGDLARWRADGRLECLGRTDNEAKIRGFRIAIEEVEGGLERLPGISAAAVRVWPDASGERALAGYLVGTGDVATWREQLAQTLPDYMIPTWFVTMDALPLTPNGKVDRKALPEPGQPTERDIVPPATPNEERLAAIWQAVLKIDQVSRTDNFFDLGGHSLLVARLLRRIQAEYGIKLPMAALFRAPKLADMAELIVSDEAADAQILVPIQPHGSQPPIIWLDGGSTFLSLAERLGLDQPFIGLSVDAVMERVGGCPKKLEDTARLVADAIREEFPLGPYRIGGWCTSGILAFAVAAHLRSEGANVPALLLAHPFHPRKSREVGSIRFFLSKVRFHIDQSLRQPRGDRLHYFLARLRGLSDAAALAGGREAVLQPALRTKLDRSATKYNPPSYDGDVAIFQPEDRPTVLDFIDDWRPHVRGQFDAFVIPGGHSTMMEEPNVDIFAAHIRDMLQRTA